MHWLNIKQNSMQAIILDSFKKVEGPAVFRKDKRCRVDTLEAGLWGRHRKCEEQPDVCKGLETRP